ncbi:hypothetical protein [Pararhodobacter oceanensis]|nr:hypothetical protein [Pararhodobacter oceanensis]
MRYILRTLAGPQNADPQNMRRAMIGDALGALALFVLAYAALHFPLIG